MSTPEYVSMTLTRQKGVDIDLQVPGLFGEAAENGYVYTSGPAVWVDPETESVKYTFLFSRTSVQPEGATQVYVQKNW